MIFVFVLYTYLSMFKFSILNRYQSIVIVILGTFMFPIIEIKKEKKATLDFFFYQIYMALLVVKSCERWFLTYCLIVLSHLYYFFAFRENSFFKD